MNQDEIAVIIPCYNEALTIGKVVDDFHREMPEATVYVYDNDSTDATAAIAMKPSPSPLLLKGSFCATAIFVAGAACSTSAILPRRSAWT